MTRMTQILGAFVFPLLSSLSSPGVAAQPKDAQLRKDCEQAFNSAFSLENNQDLFFKTDLIASYAALEENRDVLFLRRESDKKEADRRGQSIQKLMGIWNEEKAQAHKDAQTQGKYAARHLVSKARLYAMNQVLRAVITKKPMEKFEFDFSEQEQIIVNSQSPLIDAYAITEFQLAEISGDGVFEETDEALQVRMRQTVRSHLIFRLRQLVPDPKKRSAVLEKYLAPDSQAWLALLLGED